MANFIERLIKLTVNNSEANTALNKTSTNLDKVDKNTTKVTQSTKTMTKETHNLTEATVKNGGAMGLLNELTGGLAMTFKDASEAMEIAGISLTSFKGIMLATGIGAFVILVGYLAENWEKVGDALGITNSKLEKQIDLQNQVEANSEARIASQQYFVDILQLGVDTIEKQTAALKALAEVIPELKGLDLSKNKDLIMNIISDYEDFLKVEEQIKNKTDDITKLSKELRDTKNDSIGGKGTISYANKEQELFQLKQELSSLTKTKFELSEKLKLGEKAAEQNKKAASAKEKYDSDELIRLEKLRAFIKSYLSKTEDLYADTEAKKINLQEKRALLELALLRGTEEQKQIVLNYYSELRRITAEKEFKARMSEIETQSTARIESGKKENEEFKKQVDDWAKEFIAKKEFEKQLESDTQAAKFESSMQYWNDVAMISETSQGFLQVLQDESLIKSKEVRTALLLVEKGLAIANIWINEAQASAVAKFNDAQVPPFIVGPGGITVPNPAKPFSIASAAKSVVSNKINAGIATATILAQTIASFSKSSAGGGGTGGSGASAPAQAQFNIVGSSGNNQLAAAIGSAQNKPVNAYVVGSDMTTQQALDRNRITTATFL